MIKGNPSWCCLDLLGSRFFCGIESTVIVLLCCPCCTKMVISHGHALAFPQTPSSCAVLTHCPINSAGSQIGWAAVGDIPGKSSNTWLAMLYFKVKNPVLWGMVWFALAALKAKSAWRFYRLEKESSWNACEVSVEVRSICSWSASNWLIITLSSCCCCYLLVFYFNLLSLWLRPLGRNSFTWSWPEFFLVVSVGCCLHCCRFI